MSEGSLHPEVDADADNTGRDAQPLVGLDAKYQKVLDAVGTLVMAASLVASAISPRSSACDRWRCADYPKTKGDSRIDL